MKTKEEYLADYINKQNELARKGELWRLRVTVDEFLAEIEKIRAYGVNARKNNYLNEYHIQRNEENLVSVMLMDILTKEEFLAQVKKIKDAAKHFYD